MRPMIAGLAGAAALFGLAMIGTAHAATPPRVAAYNCSYLAATKGPNNVWQTWFQGVRDALFGPDQRYTAAPCFTTQADCKAWLYWAQTDWPKYNTFRACRKGLPY